MAVLGIAVALGLIEVRQAEACEPHAMGGEPPVARDGDGDDRGPRKGGKKRRRGRRDRIVNPGPQMVGVGQAVEIQIETTRPDDDDLYIYTARGLPAGLTIDETLGLISGQVNESAVGTHAVSVTATREEEDDVDTHTVRFTLEVAR